MQRLTIEIVTTAGTVVVPLGSEPVTIGRHRDNRVVIDDTGVSRYHCVIEQQGEGFQIRDLRSSNGTLLNGRKVNVAPLKHGDYLTVGGAQVWCLLERGETENAEGALPGKPADKAASIRMTMVSDEPPPVVRNPEVSGAIPSPEDFKELQQLFGKDKSDIAAGHPLSTDEPSDASRLELSGVIGEDDTPPPDAKKDRLERTGVPEELDEKAGRKSKDPLDQTGAL